MLKKLGLKRFLRLFWVTFRRKYFPKECELGSDPRSEKALAHDMDSGSSFVLALVFGFIFAFVPATLLLLGWTVPEARWVIIVLVAGGVFPLAIPLHSAISMMISINKCTDMLDK